MKTKSIERRDIKDTNNIFYQQPADIRQCSRANQLVDIAESGDPDNAECATADLAREFPLPLP
ncbi:MAG: hypothetical protein J0M04_16295 [Verrucomicrobia bacterium]|nr:hypothetical protein [Verrucomicrobiota bacterium]